MQDWFDLFTGRTEIELIPVLISAAYASASEETRDRMVQKITSKIDGSDLDGLFGFRQEDTVQICKSLFASQSPKLFLEPLDASVDRGRRLSLSEQVLGPH